MRQTHIGLYLNSHSTNCIRKQELSLARCKNDIHIRNKSDTTSRPKIARSPKLISFTISNRKGVLYARPRFTKWKGEFGKLHATTNWKMAYVQTPTANDDIDTIKYLWFAPALRFYELCFCFGVLGPWFCGRRSCAFRRDRDFHKCGASIYEVVGMSRRWWHGFGPNKRTLAQQVWRILFRESHCSDRCLGRCGWLRVVNRIQSASGWVRMRWAHSRTIYISIVCWLGRRSVGPIKHQITDETKSFSQMSTFFKKLSA